MRNGTRSASDTIIEVLLECVDCLRHMLDCIRDDDETDIDTVTKVKANIESIIESNEGLATTTSSNHCEDTASQDDASDALTASTNTIAEQKGNNRLGSQALPSLSLDGWRKHWKISFKPDRTILATGNEPYRIFRELRKLGNLDCQSSAKHLPDFSNIKSDECYLSWDISLYSDCTLDEIENCFDWVTTQAKIEIQCVELGEENFPEGFIDLSAYASPDKIDQNKKTEISTDETDKNIEHVFNEFECSNEREKQIVEATKKLELAKMEAKTTSAKQTAKDANKEKPTSTPEQSSIRVSTDKVDNLMDLVGELVITQSMLARFGKDYSEDSMEALKDGLAQLERNARELQESSMRIRMLPIKAVFSRFPRLIRDLSSQLGKQIDLQIEGEQTELDKIVMEKIGDPLVHLVRNSIDHGIETPEERSKHGKPERGCLKLNAYHEAGNIVIEINDDGAGLNHKRILSKALENGVINSEDTLTPDQIHNLIFQPGFSTAEEVTDISGRGVGMDVVRRNIQDIGGRVEVNSEEGVGTTFTIRLPLTLAILDGQLVKAGGDIFVIPLLSIIESVLINPDYVSVIGNTSIVYHFREEYIVIADLSSYGPITGRNIDNFQSIANHLLVVCECDGKKFGIIVEEMSDQQQVVIKSLDVNYKHVKGLSGGTILGDGRVALILDPVDFMEYCMSLDASTLKYNLTVNQ